MNFLRWLGITFNLAAAVLTLTAATSASAPSWGVLTLVFIAAVNLTAANVSITMMLYERRSKD